MSYFELKQKKNTNSSTSGVPPDSSFNHEWGLLLVRNHHFLRERIDVLEQILSSLGDKIVWPFLNVKGSKRPRRFVTRVDMSLGNRVGKSFKRVSLTNLQVSDCQRHTKLSKWTAFGRVVRKRINQTSLTSKIYFFKVWRLSYRR